MPACRQQMHIARMPGSEPAWQVHDGAKLLGTVEEGFGGFRAQPVEGAAMWHSSQEQAAEWLAVPGR